MNKNQKMDQNLKKKIFKSKMDQNKKKINNGPWIKTKFQNWIKMNKNPKIDQNLWIFKSETF